MAGLLRMWIKVEDDNTGELFAEFDAYEFSGRGSAWFQLNNLVGQAKDFAQYPIFPAERWGQA